MTKPRLRGLDAQPLRSREARFIRSVVRSDLLASRRVLMLERNARSKRSHRGVPVTRCRATRRSNSATNNLAFGLFLIAPIAPVL